MNKNKHSSNTSASKDEKLLKKTQKQHQSQTLLIKTLLFLAKMGVNINKPMPMKKIAICLFLSFFGICSLMFNGVNMFTRAFDKREPTKKEKKCARTFPYVASHQLLNANPRVQSGSLDAMKYFVENYGLKNFDVDAVMLKTGEILGAHPKRLQMQVKRDDLREMTLKEVRELGADDVAFPLVEALMKQFADMKNKHFQKMSMNNKRRDRKDSRTKRLVLEFGKNSNAMQTKEVGDDGWFLGVDLKDDALNVENVLFVNEIAKKYDIVRSVSFYVTDPESGATKNIQKALESSFPKMEDRIKMTWAMRDLDEKHWNLEKLTKKNLQKLKIYGILPSSKFDDAWYKKATKESDVFVESWVADDLETVLDLRKKGVSAIISNVPETIIEGIKQYCENGESYDKAIKKILKMHA